MDGHASGDVMEQEVWIDADAFTRADKESIPTGEIVPVEGTPMDFRTKKKLGRDIYDDYEALNYGMGYDHNWVLNNDGKFAKVAEMHSDESGITMEVYTDRECSFIPVTLLLMKRAKAVRSIINGRRHALRLSISRMQSTKRISRDRSAEKEIPTRQPQCTNLCSTIDIIYILALYIKITDLLFALIRDTIETQRGSQYQ